MPVVTVSLQAVGVLLQVVSGLLTSRFEIVSVLFELCHHHFRGVGSKAWIVMMLVNVPRIGLSQLILLEYSNGRKANLWYVFCLDSLS